MTDPYCWHSSYKRCLLELPFHLVLIRSCWSEQLPHPILSQLVQSFPPCNIVLLP